MSDKPLAGLLTAIAVAPLCLVCAFGPAALAAAVGSFLAWLGGFGLPLGVCLEPSGRRSDPRHRTGFALVPLLAVLVLARRRKRGGGAL
jgi:hypothetical protein